MASWIYSTPFKDIDTGGIGGGAAGGGGGGGKGRSFTSAVPADQAAFSPCRFRAITTTRSLVLNNNTSENNNAPQKAQEGFDATTRANHSNSFLHMRPYATEKFKCTNARKNFLSQRSVANISANDLLSTCKRDEPGSLSLSVGCPPPNIAPGIISPSIPKVVRLDLSSLHGAIRASEPELDTDSSRSGGIASCDESVASASENCDAGEGFNDQSGPRNEMCPTPTDMSTSPSESTTTGMNRTPSNMSISSDTSSNQGESGSSVSSDDSLACTTPTAERDSFADWESIIDDTVSYLTTSTTVSPQFEDSKFSHHNPEMRSSGGIRIRESGDCLSSESELGNSGDYEGGVSAGPCIFDDYCPRTNSQPRTATATSGLYCSDFGVIVDDELTSCECIQRTATRGSFMVPQLVDEQNTEPNISQETPTLPREEVDVGEDGEENTTKCAGGCEETGTQCVMFTVNGKNALKAADLPHIVKRLTCDKHNDPEFTVACLLTYRIFTDAQTMFSLLRQRYLSSKNNMVRLKVCGVIKQWLEKHYTDFCEGNDSALLASLLSSFIQTVTLDFPMSAAQLKFIVDRGLGTPRATTVIMRSPSSQPQTPRGKGQGQGVGAFDPAEVARQLALMEFEWFQKIRPTELLNKAWVHSKADAPNICTMINRSNTIPFWVATEIVQRDNLEERVAILRKFICIADHCRALNNYNALMEILSGLNMTAIYRLKKTWTSLPPKTLAVFQSLNRLMSPDANFSVYRKLLRKATQPRVPYLGRYLTDLVFTEDAMPLHMPNGLIHFWKCKSIAQIAMDLTSHQNLPYTFVPVVDIQCYLQQCRGLTESALLKLSRKLEPKT